MPTASPCDSQIDLFERTHARASDPSTSKEAARSMLASVEHQKKAIYWALLRAGGPITAEEIATRCSGLDKVQVGRRMSDLIDDGLVVEVDRKGKTKAGRAATRYGLRPTWEGKP